MRAVRVACGLDLPDSGYDLVNTKMNLWFPLKVGNFLTTIAASRLSDLLRGSSWAR